MGARFIVAGVPIDLRAPFHNRPLCIFRKLAADRYLHSPCRKRWGRMPAYHVDLLMADGRIDSTTTIFCPDDDQAIAWVTAMMAEPGAYPIAKVWQGVRLIAKLP